MRTFAAQSRDSVTDSTAVQAKRLSGARVPDPVAQSRREYRPPHHLGMIPIYASPVGIVQARLAINRPGDDFEREADRVAEQVMRMPEPRVQRKCACGGTCPGCQKEHNDEEEHRTVHLKAANGGGPVVGEAPELVQDLVRAPGRPLDSSTREFMESRFGHDFGGVRVHTGEAAGRTATEMNALAYTVGSNIVFGAGQYAPESAEGRHLLAHELTHVVQQSRGRDRALPPGGFDFSRIPLYSNRPAVADGRVVQRQPAAAGARAKQPVADRPRFAILFAYQRASSATAVLSTGQEVLVALPLNKLAPGTYRLERHNEIPGDFQYLLYRLDPNSEDKKGTLTDSEGFHWMAKVLGAEEVTLTIASDETAAFFRYVEAPGGLKLSIADRAHIAAAIQRGGVTRDNWFEFRHPGGIKPRTSAQAAELVDQWIKERDENRESAERSERTLHDSAGRAMSIEEGLDDSMAGIYRDYQQLQKLSRLTPNTFGEFKKAYPEGWDKMQELGPRDYKDELTARIEDQLQAYGISGIPEFEKRIDAFDQAFRGYAVHLGLQVMADAYRVCDRFLVEAHNIQYSSGWNEKGKIIAASLKPEREAIENHVEAAEEHMGEAIRKITTPWARKGASEEDIHAEINAADAEKTNALDEVSFLLPQFPFIAWPDFPRERLLHKTDPSSIMNLVSWYLIEHRAAIETARKDLLSDSTRVYKLDILLNLSKQKFEITQGSIFDLIIADKVEEASQEGLISKIETVLLFALMVASAVVTGGASVAVSFAIAGLSATQAYDLYTEYNTQLASHKANLSSLEPSEFWVIAAMIGAAMDSKAALDAFAASAGLRKAVQEFTKTRELEKFTAELDRLSHLPNPEVSERAAQAIEQKAAEMAHDAAPAAESAVTAAARDTENAAAREAETVTAESAEVMAELEQGVLFDTESAAKGHTIKITAHGKIVRCTTCGELAHKYNFVLRRDRDLAQELLDLETKARDAAAAGNRRAISRIAAQTARLEQKIIDQAVREIESLWPARLIDAEGLRAAIADHPEEVARQMEDRAAILEQQNLASGEERLGTAATHDEGMAREVRQRLRGKTPSDDIRAMVNRGRTPPYPDPVLRGLTVTGPLEADHIVAMDQIIRMHGFLELSEEDMIAVLNHPDNFIGLSKAANTSKGAKTFFDWIRHAGADTLVDPAFREEMALEELALETELQNEIQRRLRRARFATGGR
jgi:hypothetical protein